MNVRLAVDTTHALPKLNLVLEVGVRALETMGMMVDGGYREPEREVELLILVYSDSDILIWTCMGSRRGQTSEHQPTITYARLTLNIQGYVLTQARRRDEYKTQVDRVHGL